LDILHATGWFENAGARVQDGVVFLEGRAQTSEYKAWAGTLAHNTRDVAAVVNQMDVAEPPVWELGPAMTGLRDLGRSAVRSLPLVALSLVILLLAGLMARGAAALARHAFRHRALTPFLHNVMAKAIASAVFIVGLYVVLRVAGLTTVALTVMGGTGLLGLVLGIAFRGITENFLASIFLSIQKPFRTGDLILVGDVLGYVQRLTNRATVIMTLEGNLVQIPNATVYRSAICNYTSNPNRREAFMIGIGYDDAIDRAQSVAMSVLAAHPAVLKDPEPLVLVDDLGTATVNLKIYFWLDGSQHSWLKVRSSVIRLVKRAFQTSRISMPDAARELIFPQGVPVHLTQTNGEVRLEAAGPGPAASGMDDGGAFSPAAEAGLRSDAPDLERQAERARPPEDGRNIL
jgi:small-conductance mechanosensitive channel